MPGDARLPKGPPPEPPDAREVAEHALRLRLDPRSPLGRLLACDPEVALLLEQDRARVEFEFLWDGTGSPVPTLEVIAKRHGRSIRTARRWVLGCDIDPASDVTPGGRELDP